MLELVLGGARSGKSAYAEQLATNTQQEVVYIATAQAGDDEMARRIAQHQLQRPAHWKTVEAPLELTRILKSEAAAHHCLLVDCLTLWLTNCLLHDDQNYWPQQRQQFLQILTELPGSIIMVSNEVGHGIVPLGELNRRFVDEAGWLHQAVAQRADKVVLVTAGLPQYLKGKATC